VRATAPALIARYGLGPNTVGALLVSDASSELVTHERLNRGGDRSANQALWRIVVVRMVSDPRTRHYVERRTKEGKSKKDIIRASSATWPGRSTPTSSKRGLDNR
jgi:hypothetical protein